MKPETNYKISKIFKHIYTAIFWIAICGSSLFAYDFFKKEPKYEETTSAIIDTKLVSQEEAAKTIKLNVPIETLRIRQMEKDSPLLYYDEWENFNINDIKRTKRSGFASEGLYCIELQIGILYKDESVCFQDDERARDENYRYLKFLMNEFKG